MRFEGKLDIAAPRERVWQFVTDPLAVTTCAPDVQSVELIDPKHFKVVVRAGVGPIRATFNLDVVFTDLVAPGHASVRARGQAPGSAVEMLSAMDLSEGGPGHTTMQWSSDVTVTGTIAQVGARLMQGTADKLTQQIFTCIKSKLESTAAAGT